MHNRAHFNELFVSLSTAMFLLTGCATAQKEVAMPKPKKNVNVYIDNTVDLERQKNAVETYVWAINNTDSFKVEVNNKPNVYQYNVGKQLVKGTTIYCDTNSRSSKILPYTSFTSYNYEYTDTLIPSHWDKTNYQDKNFYNKKYSAKILEDEESFEILGFDSKIEAMDIFVELMRTTTREYKWNILSHEVISTGVFSEQSANKTEPNKFIAALHNAPKPKNPLHSIDYWDLSEFYVGRGFVFDPFALEHENRLIVTPVIKLYSLKDQLMAAMIFNGYNVVEDINKAKMIVNIENIFYGSVYDMRKVFPKIQQYVQDTTSNLKNEGNNLSKETETLTEQASTASSMGNSDLAKGFTGVAAANLVLNILGGDEKQQGYFVSSIVVKMDKQDILKSPNYFKLSDRTEVFNQSLCIPQIQALKSSKMFLKTIEDKLAETTK